MSCRRVATGHRLPKCLCRVCVCVCLLVLCVCVCAVCLSVHCLASLPLFQAVMQLSGQTVTTTDHFWIIITTKLKRCLTQGWHNTIRALCRRLCLLHGKWPTNRAKWSVTARPTTWCSGRRGRTAGVRLCACADMSAAFAVRATLPPRSRWSSDRLGRGLTRPNCLGTPVDIEISFNCALKTLDTTVPSWPDTGQPSSAFGTHTWTHLTTVSHTTTHTHTTHRRVDCI